MKEAFLHLIWKLKKFDLSQLQTTDGQALSVLNFGTHNHNSGPDFLNGSIKYKDNIWHGHIELHVKSTAWNQHKHQDDKAYNSVILHVVYEDDGPIKTYNGNTIPTLVLKGRIAKSSFRKYEMLTNSLDKIPCTNHMHKVDWDLQSFFLQRVLVERLEQKCERILERLKDSNNDWENVLYGLLSKYMGLKVNGAAFEQLVHLTPYSLLKKVHSDQELTEALLLGQAGLLMNQKDTYIIALKKEYEHLRHKFSLTPMSGVEWKFSRLRPANFPTIRIAQLASLYHRTPRLFSSIVMLPTISHIYELLDTMASSYWNTHYVPGKASAFSIKKIGKTTKDLLIINVIVPLLFTYGKKTDNEILKEKALHLLEELKAEDNSIIRLWKSLGKSATSAYESQALLQLKTVHCDNFNCLNCQIGNNILFK